jgi:hypothetical protein
VTTPTAAGKAADPAGVALPGPAASDRVRRAAAAAADLSAAVSARDFADWDVYDALASPLLDRVAVTPFARQATLQLLKRSPVQLRGLLRVPKLHHTKGLALFASAYARLASIDPSGRDGVAAALAHDLADRLVDRAIERPAGIGWGYDFPVQLRWGSYEPGQPNAVGTAFAGHALLDVADAVGAEDLREPARAAVSFAEDELLAERDGGRFFAYYSGATAAIHNSSLLLASLSVRALGADQARRGGAADAIAYSVERQRADGSWPYGEEAGLEWVDGFHTAYNLDALAEWSEQTGDQAARSAFERGLALYRERLIDPDGAARASLTSRYPVDIHALATAIATLSALDARGFGTLPDARRVLDWTLAHMRRDDGRLAFQRHRHWRNAIPYIRWGDGHGLLALATYLKAEGFAA